ncbi:DUF2306 domain-containing protein [Halioglobus maricola]|uniref:DUF2306 domain-containing protein n=1 Tax=Halioglobus maricola TaxID=2601894 RepID=A0A5P9NMH5_9GAMM|nr:DUF2306 domain-containing protein [Halioglobus maricola]QFU76464.1 DUF2306 domain-containing protein [Halioglobus maricola]
MEVQSQQVLSAAGGSALSGLIKKMLAILHTALGFASLIFGLLVLCWRKGDRRHRLVGRAYFFSMLGLNLSSFGMYRLFDGWGFFHWMSLASLTTLLAGYVAIRYRKLVPHYYFMVWSYIGLLCATISEIFAQIEVATAMLAVVPSLDTYLMLVLIGAGLFLLPRYQSQFVGGA